MNTAATTARIVGPNEGSEGFLGSIGARFLAFCLVIAGAALMPAPDPMPF